MAVPFKRIEKPEEILCIAIDAPVYKLCKRKNAAKAASTALLGLAARTTGKRIMSLAERVSSCAEEIVMEETRFTTENAVDKITSIYAVASDLDRLRHDIVDETSAVLNVFSSLNSHESQTCLDKLRKANFETKILAHRINHLVEARIRIYRFWDFLQKRVAPRLQHAWVLLNDAGMQPRIIHQVADKRWGEYCDYLIKNC